VKVDVPESEQAFYHVQHYANADETVKQRGLKAGVTIQNKTGQILYHSAVVPDAGTLKRELERARGVSPSPPQPGPLPPAPVPPQPGPVPPLPAPAPPQSDMMGLYILGALVVLILWLRGRKKV